MIEIKNMVTVSLLAKNSQRFIETESSLLCLKERVPILSQMNPAHTRI
jgi:hypothetical protein